MIVAILQVDSQVLWIKVFVQRKEPCLKKKINIFMLIYNKKIQKILGSFTQLHSPSSHKKKLLFRKSTFVQLKLLLLIFRNYKCICCYFGRKLYKKTCKKIKIY